MKLLFCPCRTLTETPGVRAAASFGNMGASKSHCESDLHRAVERGGGLVTTVKDTWRLVGLTVCTSNWDESYSFTYTGLSKSCK